MLMGDRIAGTEYEVVGELGRGGTAITYLARNVTTARLVAAKLVHPEASRRAGTHSRFVREARALARIKHPSVVELYEFPELSGGLRCLVMEYVAGETLASVLQRGRPKVEVCLRWLIQALEGLQAAHEARVVHRDLKPGNIMIREGDGRCVIIDFGLCKGDGLDTLQTADGVFVGTARYASPEQTSGKAMSAASDIYSMGVILYECLTGLSMFSGVNTYAVLAAHKQQPPPPLIGCAHLPGFERLQRIVWRAVAKKPKDRFPSATAFARELRDYLGEMHDVTTSGMRERHASGASSQLGRGAQPIPAAAPLPAKARARAWGQLKLGVALVAALGAGMATVVGLSSLWRRSTTSAVQAHPGASEASASPLRHAATSIVIPETPSAVQRPEQIASAVIVPAASASTAPRRVVATAPSVAAGMTPPHPLASAGIKLGVLE